MTIELETTHSPTLGKLFEALAKVQAKLESAPKDKKNPYFKSSYADLPGVWDACRSHLTDNGFAVLQTIEGTKESSFLVTWLGHSSGEWMKSKLPLLPVKQDPQAQGSAITYARRYALSAMVGVCADEDDDGEKAMGRKGKIEAPEKKPLKEDAEAIRQFIEAWEKDMPEIRGYVEGFSGHYNLSMTETIDAMKKDPIKAQADYKKWVAKKSTKEMKAA